jgi:hypothetical protein
MSNVPTNADKWRYTLYTTVILLVLFNPLMYKLVNRLLSSVVGTIANTNGCPTMLGFVIHAIVFTIVLRLMMNINI